MLEILYQDECLVAINKPHGLLVHRSPIANDVTEFALQKLRDQLGQSVYPVHRLDRKTSGVLLFGLDEDSHRKMQQAFAEGEVSKTYWAIVRGYTEPNAEIDYPLTNDKGKVQNAVTNFKTIAQAELKVPFGKHETSRYSWVEAYPKTGRMHQLRKHFAHILHPIIGDRPHGCNKQNRLFKERWDMRTMLLHARRLEFKHPNNGDRITIEATIHSEFSRMMELMGWSALLAELDLVPIRNPG